jgi:hemolysin III
VDVIEGVGLAPKPRWRGRLHLGAFVLSLPAGGLLLGRAIAASPLLSVRFAVLLYALGVSAVFGVSAAFHLGRWTPAWRERMRRADKAVIYLSIAGTYTPVSLLLVGHVTAAALLALVWVVALAGVVLVLCRPGIGGVAIGLHLGLGWVGVVLIPRLLHLDAWALLLAIGGGVLYTVGVVVLVRRRPDPDPLVFGYHEVWHTFTIMAGACHWVMLWLLLGAAR